MNINDYIRESLRQLSNHENYTPHTNYPTDKISKDIRAVLNSMLESDPINEDTFNYLKIAKPRAGSFYMLPKIHKPDALLYAVVTIVLRNTAANLWTTTSENISQLYPPILGTPKTLSPN